MKDKRGRSANLFTAFPCPSKELAIRASILNRLGDVGFGDSAGGFEVGEGAGDTGNYGDST